MKNLVLLLLLLISTFIYSQKLVYINSFEGSQSVFTTDTGSIWERGIPSMSRIDTAQNGVKVWATDLDSNYKTISTAGFTYSNLYTPFFDINGLDSIVVSFWHFVDVDSAGSVIDGCLMSTRNSVNGPWLILGYMGAPYATNWYNTYTGGTHIWYYKNSGWMFSSYSFHNTVFFEDSLQFRFSLYHNVTSNMSHDNRNGWAIDNFQLNGYGPQHDIGVVQIESPSDTALNLNGDPIIVWVKNFANDTVALYPNTKYYFSVNGTKTISTGIVLGNLLLYPNDSVKVQLTATTPVQSGPLSFCAGTMLWGDTNITNDESCISLATSINSKVESEGFYLGHCVPNPASDIVFLPVYIPNPGDISLQLFNSIGKSVLKRDVHFIQKENNLEIDIRNLADGMYYYQVGYKGEKRAGKLMISR